MTLETALLILLVAESLIIGTFAIQGAVEWFRANFAPHSDREKDSKGRLTRYPS